MNSEQQIKREAVRWFALLQSGSVEPSVEAEFLRWQAADERHARLIVQLHHQLDTLRGDHISHKQAEHLAATLAAPSRRRFIRGALAVSTIALGGYLLGRIGSTGFSMPGDLYTEIGERRRFPLDAGFSLMLNAASRVTPGSGLLRLHTGELLLDTTQTAPASLRIQTDFFNIANARHVLVRQDKERGYALSLSGHLAVEDFNGRSYTLPESQWVSVSRDGTAECGQSKGTETSWLDGMLAVEACPLHNVVERLRSYHHGILRLAPELSDLLVSGNFPLDDTHHAIRMLAAAFPIRVTELTPLWIKLEPA